MERELLESTMDHESIHATTAVVAIPKKTPNVDTQIPRDNRQLYTVDEYNLVIKYNIIYICLCLMLLNNEGFDHVMSCMDACGRKRYDWL